MEKMTHFVAKAASPLYLEASILVVVPAGIAARSTHTPVTRESNPKSLQCRYTKRGMPESSRLSSWTEPCYNR